MTVISAIVLLGILIFVHELGHFLFAKLTGVKVLKFSLGFGPRVVGKKSGETEYLISAIPLGGYVKMLGEDREDVVSDEEQARAFHVQPVWKRLLIVLSGPVFNVFLTVLIYWGVLSLGFPINVPVLGKILPVIDEVQEGYPASEAGLRQGDIILKVNGVEIDTWFEVVGMVSKNPGKSMELVVRRGEEELAVTLTPRPVEETGPDAKKVIIGRIGVKKTGGNFFETVRSESPFDAPVRAVVATYKMGYFVIDSIHKMITGEIARRNIGGPITILAESGKAASGGLLPYILFMALLSVNLALLNLLPIPVLDGGHVLFLGIEAIRKKPLSDRAVMIAQRIGLAILITLMVFAFYNDIMRLITGKVIPQ